MATTLQAVLRSTLENSHHNAGEAIITYQQGDVITESRLSYTQLLERAENNATLLKSNLGINNGSIVVLYFNNHEDNIIWLWSVLFSGAIPAMSTPFPALEELRIKHIAHVDKLFNRPIYLTRSDLIKQFPKVEGLDICTVDTLEDSSPPQATPNSYTSVPSDTALLMLTSGSTGHAKAVPLTHSQILASLAGKLESCSGPEAHKCVLNWIGFDHVAAMEAHFLALISGGDQVHIHASDVVTEPLLFLEMMQKYKVTRSFAPNFFLEKLRRSLESAPPTNLDLSSLRVLVSGGEAIVTKTLRQLGKTLVKYGAPANSIVPAFGMTETFAGCIFNSEVVQEQDADLNAPFASVGKGINGLEMRITPNPEVSDGKSGNVELRGPVVLSKYFNSVQATSAAFSEDGYFKTGDLGHLDADGNLHLIGRAKETILINGVHHRPDDIEKAIGDARLEGVMPDYTVVFEHRRNGMATEEVFVVYLPSFDVTDSAALLSTHDAIVKIAMAVTGTRPSVLPLDEKVLQKSSLGKLSRTKIKNLLKSPDLLSRQAAYEETIQEARESTFTAPETDLERLIHQVVGTYLNLPPETLGVTTPIFSLGVTSIDILQLKSKLEKRLKKTIETGTMLQNTTIRSLALALDSTTTPTYNPVVTLRPHGSKNPLWLVHPGVGDVLVFLELAKHMDDRPVYALRAKGFQGEGYFTSIPEAVNAYYTAIKATQPHGPYALAGYCYGAMLAFETSKKLEAQGDEVRFLGSFDLPPHIAWRMRQLDWVACLAHLAFFVGLITEDYSHDVMPLLREGSKRQALRHIIDVADKDRWEELALTEEALYSWTTLAHELHVIAVDYEPLGSVQSIDVFYAEPLRICASTKEDWAKGPLKEWEGFSRRELGMHDCPGGHYTMIGPDWVGGFAEILRAVLKARGL
ncbi:putative non-ribosomal peptide synthase-like protein [Westerdykella ornata]|uniref:Putative non-ribosomal peptide synthase-like protein n=1 Tax=Westerdykella ornata TaxID=318751 RepID=A0A6A6J8P3_WESOR|nr:putative non-ribosomal peptide synthase-like protein [Westerdykella ornata]KAF2272523.1 putative non-ribosomal peptide synthase-like protein [Westerdykella ornata]